MTPSGSGVAGRSRLKELASIAARQSASILARGFGGKLAGVGVDERPDLIGHSQDCLPTLFVEGDGPTAKTVEADSAFLTDFESRLRAACSLRSFQFGNAGFELLTC